MKLLAGLIDRLLFAAGLALFLQIPQFIDHYTQRLGGYRQSLAESVAQYQSSADRHYGGDLDAMADDFRVSDKPATREMGDRIVAERRRLQELDRGLSLLRQGHLLDKLGYLALHVDMPLARGTAQDFKPGMPLTTDALLCGLAGGLLATGLFNLLMWPLSALLRRPQGVRL